MQQAPGCWQSWEVKVKGLLGKKVGMAQIFDESGAVTPVTIIEAGPCYVTQVKTEKTDGYTAVQIGFSEISEKRLTKGQQGHLGLLKKGRGSKKGSIPALRYLREFRTKDVSEHSVGQTLTVEQFEVGERVRWG